MKKHGRAVLALGLIAGILAAGGCVSYGGTTPGRSTMSDVRSASGRPTDVRFGPNGDEIWEYATGPQGEQTYIFEFDRNRSVSSAVQALTENNIARILPGKTTNQDVRSLLRRPGDIQVLTDSEVWQWRIKPVGFAPETLYVFFGRDGVVTKLTRVQDFFGGSRRGGR